MPHKDFYPIDEVFFALCKHVNTPVSLGAWLKFKYAPMELLNSQLRPSDYLENDVQKFAGDYLVTEYLSKYEGHRVDIDTASVALSKFDASEAQCKETNSRLIRSRSDSSCQFASRIFRAQRKIASLLGPFSLHCIEPFFGWSPGATYDLKRREARVDVKLTAAPITVSGRALELFESVIRCDLHWSQALLNCEPVGDWCFAPGTFKIVDECRVTTVPKSSKTDRVIAIEPTGNIYLQKGVGGYFRRCLKRRGIDLDDQSVNQRLAAEASRIGLATLDLKAASDTVSKELVFELLPVDWALALDALRSHWALKPNGERVRLEKFSSMGNGFTFELESLIFWALCDSVREELDPQGVLSVYGDDLIVSRKIALDVIEFLGFAGFTVNDEKSYVDGLFFESCGKHYYNGHEVTPCYQKKTFRKDAEFIRAFNRITRWAIRMEVNPQDFPPSARLLRDSPKGLRNCVIPYGDSSDSGFLVDTTELVAKCVRTDVNRGYRVRAVTGLLRCLPGNARAFYSLELRRTREGLCQSPLMGVSDHCLNRQNYVRGKPIYGDDLYINDEDPIECKLGWRWVIPLGVCPFTVTK